ncbi:putative Glucanase [Seiridium cardinale]|uniref:Glucanase n=1 Tax=Seiridium cardinale TaxID=138064 RepID=A0ABR2Y463_9PEZI
MQVHSKIAAASALIAAVRAQQACTLTTETHPSLSWSTCTSSGSCTTTAGSVTVDANWRWTHALANSTNCYTGNEWDASLCPDGETCAQNCCLDGADYSGTYGVTTSGDALSLTFVTEGQYSTNIGSRLYLMASDTEYQGFTLLGNEFTFDVDVSNLGCGLNGAVYFVSMDLDGGESAFPTNTAGAKYGTGYCDSQCPSDVKFIDGIANSDDWEPSSNDANAGTGSKGACCSEMDIWEANSISTAYTPHPCEDIGYHSCVGDACGGTYSSDRYAGDCDPDGCDFNSYRQGNTTFYGPGSGFTLDSDSPLTIVTQFLTDDSGDLSEIKRFYVQNGAVVPNSESLIAGVSGNSITEDYCSAQKTAFGDTNVFDERGGLAQMGAALAEPMVLVMSLWDDHAANMLWLDSTYPVDSTAEGAARGTCATTSGVPTDVESNQASSTVIYSNIKFGPINSTFTST